MVMYISGARRQIMIFLTIIVCYVGDGSVLLTQLMKITLKIIKKDCFGFV